MRSLKVEILSDGVWKDQISALAYSCLFRRLESDAKAGHTLDRNTWGGDNQVAVWALQIILHGLERFVTAGP
jgi:hypothetical protein